MGYKEEVFTGKTIPEVIIETVELDPSPSSLVTTGRSSQQIMRSYILEASKANTIAPEVYRDVLRSMIATFGDLHYLDGDSKVKRVKAQTATPERAIAKQFKENSIILPMITIGQLGSDNDPSKRRYDNVLIQGKTWNEDQQRAQRVISLADVPVAVTYSINLWTKYSSDMDQLTQSIRLKFNPSTNLKTGFSDNLKSFLQSEDNSSSLVVGDGEDRLLRKSFRVKVEFFIPSPRFMVTSTGRIEKIHTDLWVSEK